MATRDPYQTLGISKTATQDEIKSAYRDLAKKHHPDLNPGSKDSERKFKEISRAYEWIGTPEGRSKFDRGEFEEAQPGTGSSRQERPFYYRTQQHGGSTGGRYTSSFGEEAEREDLFESLFGGGFA